MQERPALVHPPARKLLPPFLLDLSLVPFHSVVQHKEPMRQQQQPMAACQVYLLFPLQMSLQPCRDIYRQQGRTASCHLVR